VFSSEAAHDVLGGASRGERAVGRRVAELRGDRGWTQETFAERLGVSVQYLRRIELGKTHITVPKLVEFANALRVAPAALFAKPRSMTVQRGRPVKRKLG
jgi:transcriptional regulator with XRE-family HTH domain